MATAFHPTGWKSIGLTGDCCLGTNKCSHGQAVMPGIVCVRGEPAGDSETLTTTVPCGPRKMK